MGDVPTQINVPATIVETVIQKAVYGAGRPALQLYLTTMLPFLGWPIIRQSLGLFLDWMCGFMYPFFSMPAIRMVIDIQTNAENSAVKISIDELKKAQESGDQDAIEKAAAQFDANFGRLVHWDGTVNK